MFFRRDAAGGVPRLPIHRRGCGGAVEHGPNEKLWDGVLTRLAGSTFFLKGENGRSGTASSTWRHGASGRRESPTWCS